MLTIIIEAVLPLLAKALHAKTSNAHGDALDRCYLPGNLRGMGYGPIAFTVSLAYIE